MHTGYMNCLIKRTLWMGGSTYHHGSTMALVRTVKRLQIIYGIHIIGSSSGVPGSSCRASRLLPLTMEQLLLGAKAIGCRIALVDTQPRHIDVDTNESAQPMASTRRYGNAIRDEPVAQCTREIRICPPALIVVIRWAWCKLW